MAVIDYSASEEEKGSALEQVLSSLGRYVAPVLMGGVMTIALLYLMQALISSREAELNEDRGINLVDFVRVPDMSDVRVKQRHPKKPPPPEEVPPETEKLDFNVAVDEQAWGMQPLANVETADLRGGFSFASDGSYLPIVKVQPAYPRTAMIRGQEGWVVLEFTVDELGRVVDPVVVDNCAHITLVETEEECWDQPNNVFNQAALRAAVKFKYKPKVVDGVAVATPHIRHKFTFELDDE
jgi:protein TonB